jgi:hypothetical protein
MRHAFFHWQGRAPDDGNLRRHRCFCLGRPRRRRGTKQLPHLLVGRLREVPIGVANREERRGRRRTHDLVDHGIQLSAGRIGRGGHRHHDPGGSQSAKGLDSGAPRRLATSSAAGTPPRGRARTMTSRRSRYRLSRPAKTRPASLRSRNSRSPRLDSPNVVSLRMRPFLQYHEVSRSSDPARNGPDRTRWVAARPVVRVVTHTEGPADGFPLSNPYAGRFPEAGNAARPPDPG